MKSLFVSGLAFLIGLVAVTATGSRSFGQAGSSMRQEVVVFAAASVTNALDELGRTFQQQAGVRMRLNYESSATLAQQIANGAPADIFLSADEQWAKHLAEQKLISRQRNLLTNRLVVVIPADSQLRLSSPGDLVRPEIRRLAMGDPDGVPAGKYAREALRRMQLWDRLKSKSVSASDVRHALTFVETGAAEAGIVYATDAAISKKVKVACEIPLRLSSPIRYPLVLLKQGAGKAAAVRFYEFVQSPAARVVFRKYGFAILDASESGW
jgi:molybdate transport system substrate-binding protein